LERLREPAIIEGPHRDGREPESHGLQQDVLRGVPRLKLNIAAPARRISSWFARRPR
jgi:hypothetical protein